MRIQHLQGPSRIHSTTRNIGSLTVSTTQRNTTALFGVGLIDSITDEQIEAVAAQKHKQCPRVAGRVPRTKDGRVAKFGWKGNVASLRDFTMAACAIELGLHVPGQSQSPVPYEKYEPTGLDLNERELGSLVDYLTTLPPPVERRPQDKAAAAIFADGKELFTSIGCATCHSPKVGNVEGIYSDLLLHDLGPQLGDVSGGAYGQTTTSSPLPLAKADEKSDKPKHVPAAAVEWRTPPLWGCRDSGPYLHDGRADSLEQAVALHDGEAQDSTLQFLMLTPQKRQLLIAFLKTLRAPEK